MSWRFHVARTVLNSNNMMTTDLALYYSFSSWYGRTFGFGMPFWLRWRPDGLYLGFEVPADLVPFFMAWSLLAGYLWIHVLDILLAWFWVWTWLFLASGVCSVFAVALAFCAEFFDWLTFYVIPGLGLYCSFLFDTLVRLNMACLRWILYMFPPCAVWRLLKTACRALGHVLKLALSISFTLVVELFYLPSDFGRLFVGSWGLWSALSDLGRSLLQDRKSVV